MSRRAYYLFINVAIATLIIGCKEKSSILDSRLFREDNYSKKAIDFLMHNRDNYNVTYSLLVNNKGGKLKFSPYNYETLFDAKEALDSLTKDEYSRIKLEEEDSRLVSNNYLVEQANYMTKLWENTKLEKDISFNDFCEFLLPYRGGIHRIEVYKKMAAKGDAPDLLRITTALQMGSGTRPLSSTSKQIKC